MREVFLSRVKIFKSRLFISLSAAILFAVGGFLFVNRTQASNPTSGTLGDTVGTSVSWVGTLPPGTAANGEPSCTTGNELRRFYVDGQRGKLGWKTDCRAF
jgi:hypothetical protein